MLDHVILVGFGGDGEHGDLFFIEFLYAEDGDTFEVGEGWAIGGDDEFDFWEVEIFPDFKEGAGMATGTVDGHFATGSKFCGIDAIFFGEEAVEDDGFDASFFV